MKLHVLAAAAMFTLLQSTVAQASESFELEIRGSGTRFDYYTPPDPITGDPFLPANWMASVGVTTSSAADGTYTGGGLEAITFATNYFDGFNYAAGDTQFIQYGTERAYLVGMEPGASVTLAGGHVVSINFTWDWPYYGSGISMAGLGASEQGAPDDGPTTGGIWVTGTAVQIPEPTPAVLMLLGLGALTGLHRIRGSVRAR